MANLNSILLIGIAIAIFVPSSLGLNITGKLAINGRLKPGDVITIEGKVLDIEQTGLIAFENEHCDWDFDTKECLSILHQKIQYRGSGIEFVRSFFTWYNGGLVNLDINWIGPLEAREQDFKIQIIVDSKHYKQIYNGKALPKVKWIYPLETAQTVRVYGSVKVYSIKLN